MYGQERFTTITTHHVAGTPATIEQRQEALDALYQRFVPPVRETNIQNTGGVWSGNEHTELPLEAAYDAVLQRLLSGDISNYKSPSNADYEAIALER